MLNPIIKTIQYGSHTLTLETGAIARQATGAVLATMDDTSVLVTVVAKKTVNPGQDFFPLTVDYVEKAYASGKIPGGFLRREGRPTDNETLVARLIDRPIRPLFPENFFNDVQIIAQVMSSNPEVPADIVALIGASAALSISGVPFDGPVGAARVGFIDGQYILNTTYSDSAKSQLELVVAGTEKAVLMVESQADMLTEEQMLGAVVFGHQQQQAVINMIKEFAAEAGKERWEVVPPEVNQELVDLVSATANPSLEEAYTTVEKTLRQDKLAIIKEQVIAAVAQHYQDREDAPSEKEALNIMHDLEYHLVRRRILEEQPRIDGRDLTTVRALDIKVGVLPRTHGSAIFTRGETQAIGVVTLGTEGDAQIIESAQGSYNDKFLFHYNFPPFSVGETGRFGSPKRREIGHGNLAKRGITAVIPKDYPYTIRVVSEITESNGSSSMASVCAASLSLMDAGIPVSAPVAGIAMGLVLEGDRYQVITDILGDEDHLGDMDFKVAGTETGITALQMDIKIQGITQDIMQIALNQAKAARMHILGVMNSAIASPRADMSEFAPRIETLQIDAKKIKDVIGKGGSVIRGIIEQTKTSIDISDEGLISIASSVKADIEAAIEIIKNITTEPEVGAIYNGKVTKIVDFGAFVAIVGSKEGLLHISQISNERVNNVTDHISEGQEIRVKVTEIDRQGKIRLSVKDIQDGE